MLTSCNTKPQRGVTMVASRFRSALCDASRLKNESLSRTYGTLSVNILITSH